MGYVLGQIPLGPVIQAVANTSSWGLAAWGLLNLAALALFAARWRVLLAGLGVNGALISLTLHRLASFAVSFLTPGPQFGGEPLQILLLRRRHGVSSAAALGSVTLDKAIELISNFAFLALGAAVLAHRGLPGPPSLPSTAFSAMLLVVPCSYLVGLWCGARPLSGMLGRLRHPRLRGVRASVVEAERGMERLCKEQPKVLACAVGISAASWLLQLGEFWLVLRLVGTESTLLEAVLLLTLVRFAFLLPLPGGLGVVEAALIFGFQALALPAPLGAAAALLMRARDVSLAAVGMWWGARALQDRADEQRRSQLQWPKKSSWWAT